MTESIPEQAASAWLGSFGYTVVPGSWIAPENSQTERANYWCVVLEDDLCQALVRPRILTSRGRRRRIGKGLWRDAHERIEDMLQAG